MSLCRAKDRAKKYQSAYIDKLCKINQSLLHADETAATVKHLEYAIKVKDNFVALDDEDLTKLMRITQSVTRTEKFFNMDKPKIDGSMIRANACALHASCTQDAVCDLRREIEVEEIDLGLK